MSAVSLIADEQARLETSSRRPPPATLAEVSILAARLDAETQQALWHIATTPPGSMAEAAARAAYRERVRQARRLYWYKRILVGWRHPGAYLRTAYRHRPAEAPSVRPKMQGGGMNAGAAALAAERAARLVVARAAIERGASMAEAASLAGYRSAHVLRTVLATERMKARRKEAA